MKKVFYLIVGCLCILPLYAQEEKVEKIDSYLDLLENNQQGIASVAISQGGELIYQRKIGYSAMPAEITERKDLKGRIGSISKMITATLLFQLIEEGRLTLDEPLKNYFPEMPNSEKITISYMLNHTSGLGDIVVKNDSIIDWLFEPVATEEILKEIIRQGVLFEVGEKVRYSNSAYYLLAKIVEEKFEQPYEEVVKERITDPLVLKNTAANVADHPSALSSYRLNYATGQWNETKDFYFPNVIGVGDMLSTPEDLLIFINALFKGGVVSAVSLEQMLPEEGRQFGRGLMLAPFYEKKLYGHGGSTFGSYSLVAFNPEDQVAFSILMNGQETTMNDVMIGILSLWYGREFVFPVFRNDADKQFEPGDFTLVQGVYGAEGFPLKISVFEQDGELFLQGSGQPAFNLEQTGVNTFVKKAFFLEVEFDENGKQMTFTQAGQTFVLEKE